MDLNFVRDFDFLFVLYSFMIYLILVYVIYKLLVCVVGIFGGFLWCGTNSEVVKTKGRNRLFGFLRFFIVVFLIFFIYLISLIN